MYKIGIKMMREGARMPTRAHDDDTCLDAYASLPNGAIELETKPRRVPLGFAVNLTPGLGLQVRPRSGLSLAGVHVIFGTVDSGYRGEICATMWTTNPGGVWIADGHKVAQLALEIVPGWHVVTVDYLSETNRGDKGYGSSGI